MDYDVVIATRNRLEALRISIPLILNQNRAPRKLIIVDASDDHEGIRQTVTKIVSDSPVTVKILESAQRNSALQRNIGLEHVESPVVMFPDDDSFWWPDVAEKIMRIYEQDMSNDIGGVCAVRTDELPSEISMKEEVTYDMRLSDRILRKVSKLRVIIDNYICPNPMYVHGRSRWPDLTIPKWLPNVSATIIEYMNGLCMTFRSEIFKRYGYDNDLGAYVGWAANEDVGASFAVMQEKVLVCVPDARVCHHKFPTRRGNGFELGFINHFNRAYVICRYSAPGSPARRSLKRFGYYKALQYCFGLKNGFGRDRLRGHLQALRSMKLLLKSSTEDLRDCYLEQCQKVLAK